MPLNFENLSPERFQQLCQTLALHEYPGLQCLPIGQPDGGRDGVTAPDSEGRFTVLQVKFARNPLIRESREEFIEVIGSLEKDKVAELCRRGLSQYILATNVQGTAHLDNGSIDRAKQHICEFEGVDIELWWRDDIERRLEKHPEVKWSFVEILNGSDILGMLVSGIGNSYSERTYDALKAFMAHQYSKDAHTKFKQLDIDKDIMSLFIDLPVEINFDETDRSIQVSKLQELIEEIDTREGDDDGEFSDLDIPGETIHDSNLHCVELLINPVFSANSERIVIEGAPGQGKSTITQFLCQAYRMQLLSPGDLDRIPSRLRPTEVVLPLRFDLRDYAQWLVGRNPWAVGKETPRAKDTTDLLESFIVGQIEANTAHQISVSDFTAFSKGCRLLIALDGFDEVADPKLRERIVEQICQAYARLKFTSLSLKIIVASRPTAFIDSPRFPTPDWLYVSLASLTSREISDYSRNWFEAMKLSPETRATIVGTLREKLPHSHIAYLAKNPMQLSILLSLVWKQGSHLPDKRTALYDKYIDTFLDREAEKSDLVRDQRDLLISILGYIATYLQLESELDESAGKINQERLRVVVEEFLKLKKFPLDILDAIFTGVTQRVVAIVSRTAGTFEFEVQPLQEYFAAKYLYSNANYSRDSQRKGAIHDIFQSISKNYYWMNTARFFAGCYNSGELPSLVFDLDDVQSSKEFENTAHVTRIKLNLLSDHVFSQRPALIQKIVGPILKNGQFDILLSKINAFDADFSGSYPWGPSKKEVIDHCIDELKIEKRWDRQKAIVRFLAQTISKEETTVYWDELNSDELDAGLKLLLAAELGIIERLDDDAIAELVNLYGDQAIFYIIPARRQAAIDKHPVLWLKLLDGVKSGVVFPNRYADEPSAFGSVMLMLADLAKIPTGFSPSIRSSERPIGMMYPRWRTVLSRNYPTVKSEVISSAPSMAPRVVIETLLSLCDLLNKHVVDLREDISPLVTFLESYKRLLGQRVIGEMITIRLVSLINFSECSDSFNIDDDDVRFLVDAQKNARDQRWWKSVISLKGEFDAVSPTLRLGCYLLTTRRPVADLGAGAEDLLENLTADQWREFAGCYSAFQSTIAASPTSRTNSGKDLLLPSARSSRLLCLSILRNRPNPSFDLVRKHFPNPEQCDKTTIHIIASHLSLAARNGDFEWKEVLHYFAEAHARGVEIPLRRYSTKALDIPLEVAVTVCSNTHLYPLSLLDICERRLADEAGRSVTTITDISRDQRWFLDD